MAATPSLSTEIFDVQPFIHDMEKQPANYFEPRKKPLYFLINPKSYLAALGAIIFLLGISLL